MSAADTQNGCQRKCQKVYWHTEETLHRRRSIPIVRYVLRLRRSFSLFSDHRDGTWYPAIDQSDTDLHKSRLCKEGPITFIGEVLLEIRAGFVNGLIETLPLLFVHIGRDDQFPARPAYPVKFGQRLMRIIKYPACLFPSCSSCIRIRSPQESCRTGLFSS